MVRPVLADLQFDVDVAHEIAAPGNINDQVIRRLIEADLVVANLTSLNPNVMYELGVRHATNRPVVILKQDDGIRLPFDVSSERTLFYKNDMMGVEELRPVFRVMCEAALRKQEDSPITKVMKRVVFEQAAPSGSTDEFVLDELRAIRAQLAEPQQRTETTAAAARAEPLRFMGILNTTTPIEQAYLASATRLGAMVVPTPKDPSLVDVYAPGVQQEQQLLDLAERMGVDLIPF